MANTDSRKPSLDDACARVGRAKEHIASLEHEIATVMPANRTISAMAPPGFVSASRVRVNPPPIVAILIGETIYNLRGALDYLLYELFYLDTGELQERTKFPVETTKHGWTQHLPISRTKPRDLKRMWLHRLTPDHQAAIKRLQPCYGCKWTGQLHDFSNLDKHRHLLMVDATVSHGRSGAIGGLGPMMVQFERTGQVAFDDGSFVIETLNIFQQQVANVIETFDSDFK